MYHRINTDSIAAFTCLIILAGCSHNLDNNNPTSNGPPSINRVFWTHQAGCSAGTASKVTISVNVSDPDNGLNDLTFSGFVSNCTGSINGATSAVTCPQLGQYNGSVTVTDPAGSSDSITFSFGPCQDGVATK
ncbi:MAG: hypothetical protein ACE5IR_24880 [bacterium]